MHIYKPQSYIRVHGNDCEPENTVSSLVNFPCPDKSKVSGYGRLENISFAVEFTALLFYTWRSNASRQTARVVTLWYRARFNSGICTGRREKRGYTCSVCPNA